ILVKLGFQLFKSLKLANLKTRILRLPLVKGRLADAIIPADVCYGLTAFLQSQNGDDLTLRKLRFFHVASLKFSYSFYIYECFGLKGSFHWQIMGKSKRHWYYY